METVVKAYWNDCNMGLASYDARDVDLREAGLIWTHQVRGVAGNFLGLVDDAGRTVQFFFEQCIPNRIDDAGHLQIVLLDFPQPELNGSCARRVAIGGILGLIETAFREGADHRRFEPPGFAPW